MTASFLPSLLVPIVAFVLPTLGIISFLKFVDKEEIK